MKKSPTHQTRRASRAGALPSSVSPRLLNRQQAATYLGMSPSKFDAHRVQGFVPAPVPVPSTRDDGILSRVPLFDVRDLDGLIDSWKAGGVQ